MGQIKCICFFWSHGSSEPLLCCPKRKLFPVQIGKEKETRRALCKSGIFLVLSGVYVCILFWNISIRENNNPDSQCFDWENKCTIFNPLVKLKSMGTDIFQNSHFFALLKGNTVRYHLFVLQCSSLKNFNPNYWTLRLLLVVYYFIYLGLIILKRHLLAYLISILLLSGEILYLLNKYWKTAQHY